MKALIFGKYGQDGTYLAKILRREGVEPISGTINRLGRHTADILAHKPDYVFHLAAASTTAHYRASENHLAIATGAFEILETVKSRFPECRVFVAGSALQYDDPPASVYACARNYARELCHFYDVHNGLKTHFGIFYHHESPLRKPTHVSRMIADAAREGRKIEIGDLNVVKEWTFAGDIAEAIWMMVKQDEVVDCEICSGEGYSIGEWAEACYAAVGLNWKDYVTAKDGFVPDYTRMVGNPEVIKSIGWKPKVGFKELAEMMVKSNGATA